MELEYKILDKNELLIITLKGKIIKESREELSRCLQEASAFEQKTVVLIMKDVSKFDAIMSRDLTLLQQQLRTKNKNLFLVGLKAPLKEELDFKGIIRAHEVKSSVEEIIARMT